ncbi:integrase [Polynucleobacter sp. UK-Gri1-W3]|uniref:tyrosine-type recombinase/integrase n=1 Tax=Polynucleobacter sp. UK-Gri1-W3 TaxID=1819737 RepID=UPI001C0DB650|nr:integrase [Polynucleobacter sp. UK-Gri1-W3]MBU3539041.1 integrase [Polynucleobacter sp. UK-Gri1-W3]
MPKPRKSENKGLPERWRSYHGAYYFSVPVGLEHLWEGKKQFRLGKTLPQAYAKWAERIGAQNNAQNISELLDRYLIEVVPTKAISSRESNLIWIKQIRSVFGTLKLSAIQPQHIYKYVDMRTTKKLNENGNMSGGKTTAHREMEVLSHCFTKAVEWGYIHRHPFKNEVRLKGEKSRDRYIEDWEILEMLSMKAQRIKGSVRAIQAYIRLKIITGMARSDLLRLTMSNLKEDGIHIQRHKTAKSTGKRTIYLWDPELRDCVEKAKAARPALSTFLFCKKDGHGYFNEETGKANGWDSMWQRFCARVLKETKVDLGFTEHDLRAKCASDAETLEHARALLSHADGRTTDKIYRRKPEKIASLGMKKAS